MSFKIEISYDYGGDVDIVYDYKSQGTRVRILVVIFLVYTIPTDGPRPGLEGRSDQNKPRVSGHVRGQNEMFPPKQTVVIDLDLKLVL